MIFYSENSDSHRVPSPTIAVPVHNRTKPSLTVGLLGSLGDSWKQPEITLDGWILFGTIVDEDEDDWRWDAIRIGIFTA